MYQLKQLEITARLSDFNDIDLTINRTYALINEVLWKCFDNLSASARHNDNIFRYVDIESTLAVLSDSYVKQYFNEKAASELYQTLDAEAKILRQYVEEIMARINVQDEIEQEDDIIKGKTRVIGDAGNECFKRFDKLLKVLIDDVDQK